MSIHTPQIVENQMIILNFGTKFNIRKNYFSACRKLIVNLIYKKLYIPAIKLVTIKHSKIKIYLKNKNFQGSQSKIFLSTS